MRSQGDLWEQIDAAIDTDPLAIPGIVRDALSAQDAELTDARNELVGHRRRHEPEDLMAKTNATIEFAADTTRLIAVLDAITRHAGALAEELRTIQAGAETAQPERLIDPDCRDNKHAPICVGGPCECDCHRGGA